MKFPFLLICLISLSRPRISGCQTVWPNDTSRANSDQWLVKNHDRIRQLRPKLLVLNFANGVSPDNGRLKVEGLIAALKESTRYHGYINPTALPFLAYEIGKFVDLTDASPPPEKLD